MNIIYFLLYILFALFAGLMIGDASFCEHGLVIDRPFFAILAILLLIVLPFINYRKHGEK